MTEPVNQVLAKALKMEQFRYNFFSLLEEHADDAESRLMFLEIAKEEEKHCDMFMLELEMMGEEIADETDYKPEGAFGVSVTKIVRKGPSMVLLYAILVKQKIIDFYIASVDKSDNSWTKMFITELIGHEEEHVLMLNEKLVKIQNAA
ncbi:MAG: ferritin family protein [Thermoplasmata archaeon]|nr:ferritin family protein [Thermoplasmata archaeon]